ncbi:putative fungal specific transcription [Diplodia seriata]|uniref:Putative fungal specific transcription n=1 Tax=Diplodia seriata TaxID=420778 RepID=A0A0G2F0H7_9PEZI|nr:putative fungal specific transcription [Diplodia seriata]
MQNARQLRHYESSCKRRVNVNTNTYLVCLHSPNLARDRTSSVSPRHVETEASHTYPVDVIVFATGFLSQKWLYLIEVRGAGGRSIHDVWAEVGGAEAYMGTVLVEFPNFFVMYGPNAATGQHSVIFRSECQSNYACRLLRPVLKGEAKSVSVREEAQKDLSWVLGRLEGLVFNAGFFLR